MKISLKCVCSLRFSEGFGSICDKYYYRGYIYRVLLVYLVELYWKLKSFQPIQLIFVSRVLKRKSVLQFYHIGASVASICFEYKFILDPMYKKQLYKIIYILVIFGQAPQIHVYCTSSIEFLYLIIAKVISKLQLFEVFIGNKI